MNYPRDIVVVVYHHLGDGDEIFVKGLGLSTKPEVFEKHVKYFSDNFDCVSGSDLVAGDLPQKPILITFDDAFSSVVKIGGPILKARGVPSLFLVTAAAVAGSLPIDNLLSCAVQELGIAKVASIVGACDRKNWTLTELIAKVVPTRTVDQIKYLKEQLLSHIGSTERELRNAAKMFLDRADLRKFRDYGMELGNHSMTHAFFRSLSREELATEIVEAKAFLEQNSGLCVSSLSIPYGNLFDATSSALELARASGHKAIFLVHAKSNRARLAPDLYYRTDVCDASTRELLYRLKVLPLLRVARDWLWSRGKISDRVSK
jgi:peptidoglycan/xylan/chitin deacetylase (PgdA/CDA1 family)